MISDTMTSMNMLRQEAAAIGITDVEARKYGDLRHKRTWSLAIEHHLSIQEGFGDREALEADGAASDFDSALNHSLTDLPPEYNIQLTANLGESGVKSEQQTPFLASPPQPGSAILCVGVAPVGAGFANGRSHNNSTHDSNQTRGFKQVVQNHIKALTIASASSTNQLNSQLSNWVCPECGPEGESGCHLCAGSGDVSDIEAIGWTLAYMEMLGCSAREIEPLRKYSAASETLELHLKVCVAIKQSNQVLARTEKWVIGNR